MKLTETLNTNMTFHFFLNFKQQVTIVWDKLYVGINGTMDELLVANAAFISI